MSNPIFTTDSEDDIQNSISRSSELSPKFTNNLRLEDETEFSYAQKTLDFTPEELNEYYNPKTDYKKEDHLIIILRGPDDSIEKAIEGDITLINYAFNNISKVHSKILKTSELNSNLLILSIKNSMKKYESILVWYTGHADNQGHSYPAIPFENVDLPSNNFYDAIIENYNFEEERCKLFGLIIDACNSFNIRNKSLSIKNNYYNTIKQKGLSFKLFSDFIGTFHSISSQYGNPSGCDEKGSYYTRRFLYELLKKPNWLNALLESRNKLYRTQKPFFKQQLNVRIQNSPIVKKLIDF